MANTDQTASIAEQLKNIDAIYQHSSDQATDDCAVTETVGGLHTAEALEKYIDRGTFGPRVSVWDKERI